VAVGDGLGTPALRVHFLACRYPLCIEFSLFGVGLVAVSVLISVSDNISLWFTMRKRILQDRNNYRII
jgi:hypothetical protein